MANALNVKIGGDLRELEKALDSAAGKIRSAGKRMTSVGKTLTASVTAPLTALGITSLKTAADFETLQVAMNTLNGSVREGARNFERLKEFSAGTPFQLQDLAKAQNMLQGFGMEADDAFNSLSMIGDIAAISGGSIEGIGVAFGQAAAEGRLMTRDIRQLINQGVPAIKLLADTMGVAQSEVLDLASEGEISFDILQQAFRDATSEGGMFANGMQQQSQTLNGLFSTLKDNVSIAMAEIGESIADAMNLREVVPAMIERIKQITHWFKNLSKEARVSIVNLVRSIALIGPGLIAAGVAVTSFAAVIGALTTPIGLVIAAITGIVLAAAYVVKNLEAIGDAVKEEFRSWVVAAQNTKTLIEKAVLSIASLAPGIAGTAARAMNKALKVDQGVIDENKAEFQSFGEFAKDIAGDIGSTFANMLDIDFSGMFAPVNNEAQEFGKSIGMADGHVETLEERIKRLGESFTELVKPIENASSTWEKFKTKFEEIGGEFKSFLAGEMSNAVLSFGDALGRSLAGAENEWQTTFEKITMVVLEFAQSLARLAGAIGGVMLFIPGLQGAGAGLLAAAAALQAAVSFGRATIEKNAQERKDAANSVTSVNDALIMSNGNIVKFNSADDILASRNMDQVIGGGVGRVEVFGTLKGQDLFISSDRGSKTYGR